MVLSVLSHTIVVTVSYLSRVAETWKGRIDTIDQDEIQLLKASDELTQYVRSLGHKHWQTHRFVQWKTLVERHTSPTPRHRPEPVLSQIDEVCAHSRVSS